MRCNNRHLRSTASRRRPCALQTRVVKADSLQTRGKPGTGMQILGLPNDLPKRAVVQLLVFSGRRDPTWELRDNSYTELAKRLVELPALDFVPAPPPEPQLGYRG